MPNYTEDYSPKYEKETPLYDTKVIEEDIDEASQSATAFLTKGTGGVMVYDASEGIKTPENVTTKNVYITPDDVQIRNGTTTMAKFGTEAAIYNNNGVELAHFGYASGKSDESGTTGTAPYYTLGMRLAGSDKGNYSMVEGGNNVASGASSHAEGGRTVASGAFSHAEGGYTEAIGNYAHASGYKTTAGYATQTALGRFNENKADNALEIGWGNSETRKNVFEVNTTGQVTVEGHASPIGTEMFAAQNDSTGQPITVTGMSNRTNGASLTLRNGVWLVTGYWHFQARSSGTANNLEVGIWDGELDPWDRQRITVYGNTQVVLLQTVAIISVGAESKTYYVYGASMQEITAKCPNHIHAVRIA